jgi:heme-degrading monooxygenase HmoA
MCVVITCIEVPAGADASVDPLGADLHRALAVDAPFRYITLGDTEPVVCPVGTSEVATYTGRYEVCHSGDQAAAPFDPTSDDAGVIFINCMKLTPGSEERAFEKWRQVNAYMVTKPGYQWHRLHLRLHNDAPFGLINVVGWESAPAWTAAHDAGFRALTGSADLPFVPVPTLCELVETGSLHTTGTSA